MSHQTSREVVPFKTRMGSIRGVNQMVAKRIKTFSNEVKQRNRNQQQQQQQQNGTNNNDVIIGNKIVIYTTSLNLLRKTKSQCSYAKTLLRCLMFKTEERDIVDQRFRKEYEYFFAGMPLPQIIIRHKHIGGVRELEDLVESGRIVELTGGIEKVAYFNETCGNCGGFSYVNCGKCGGSCRSRVTRFGRYGAITYLRCSYCEEGLVRCEYCADMIH